DVDKHLWIAIGQRKPRTLHLYHDAMATAEGVVHVRHCEVDLLNLAGSECLRLFETVSKFPPERLAAHQLLVSAHGERWWWNVGRRLVRVFWLHLVQFAIRIIRRIHIDQFHIPIGVSARSRNEKPR